MKKMKKQYISFVIEKIQSLILYVEDENNFAKNNNRIIEIKERFNQDGGRNPEKNIPAVGYYYLEFKNPHLIFF